MRMRLQVRRDVALVVGIPLLVITIVLVILLLVVVGVDVVPLVHFVHHGAGPDAVPVTMVMGGVGVLLVVIVIVVIADGILFRPSPPSSSSSTLGR